jgi:hypothetical protein
MDDVGLSNYMAGCFLGPVEAGRADRFCAGLLTVEPGTPIWLSAYTLEKLRYKHGDINFQHYRHMPTILLNGFVARGRKPKVIELWLVTRTNRETMGFFAALKATRKGEVFVETLHRISLKEARRLLRRARAEARIVREQPDAGSILQAGTDHLKIKRKVA